MSTNDKRADEAKLADHYLDVATLGREVAGHALVQALADAKAGTLRDPGKTAVSAITASAIALDKRLLLQERPTQYIAVDPAATLSALARRVGLKYDAETTAVDIPASETPQLAQPQTPTLSSPSGESVRKTRAREGSKPAAD